VIIHRHYLFSIIRTIGGETKFNAFIIDNGDVIYNPGDVFEAKCPTDISKFPFDEQQCVFTVLSDHTQALPL
jgi:hypothetical protein